MNKIGLLLITGLICHTALAIEPPINPHVLPPPHPVMPQAGNDYISGNDKKTQSWDRSDMDTVTTQSVGSSEDYHPRSYPIPLDLTPPE